MKQLTNLYDQPEATEEKDLVYLGKLRDLASGFYNGNCDAIPYTVESLINSTFDKEFNMRLLIAAPSSSSSGNTEHSLTRIQLDLAVKNDRRDSMEFKTSLNTEAWIHRNLFRGLSEIRYFECPVLLETPGMELRIANENRQLEDETIFVRSYEVCGNGVIFKKVTNVDGQNGVVRNLVVDMMELSVTEQERMMQFVLCNVDEDNKPSATPFKDESGNESFIVRGGLDLAEEDEKRVQVVFTLARCTRQSVVENGIKILPEGS